MMIVYGIPGCDTVKKARAWLAERGIAYGFHDFKRQGVPAEKLLIWASLVGWDKLLNRQGTTWRKLDFAAQAAADTAAGAAALAIANPSVIKRPVVEWRAGALGYFEGSAANDTGVGSGDGAEAKLAVTVGFDGRLWALFVENGVQCVKL